MEATVTEEWGATQKSPAQPTTGGSVYVKQQDIPGEPTQFEGISMKVLNEDKPKGEMTCLLKWEPGATLRMHQHPEIEQTFVSRGLFMTTTASVAPGIRLATGWFVRRNTFRPGRSSSPYIA